MFKYLALPIALLLFSVLIAVYFAYFYDPQKKYRPRRQSTEEVIKGNVQDMDIRIDN